MSQVNKKEMLKKLLNAFLVEYNRFLMIVSGSDCVIDEEGGMCCDDDDCAEDMHEDDTTDAEADEESESVDYDENLYAACFSTLRLMSIFNSAVTTFYSKATNTEESCLELGENDYSMMLEESKIISTEERESIIYLTAFLYDTFFVSDVSLFYGDDLMETPAVDIFDLEEKLAIVKRVMEQLSLKA